MAEGSSPAEGASDNSISSDPLAGSADAGHLGSVVAVAAIAVGVILAVFLAALAALSGLVAWWLAALVGLIVGAVAVVLRVRRAHDIALGALTGSPQSAQVSAISARVDNTLEGMSLLGGVAIPEVIVLDEDALNAVAIRRADKLTIGVTRGLVDGTELIELEGVVAELVARLRNGDAESATVGAALFELTPQPLKSLLAPVARTAKGRLLDEGRDLQADRQAVTLTRYPPGLASALAKISADDSDLSCDHPALRPLWLVDPRHAELDRGTTARVEGERAPLALRIDVLAEL